MSNIPNRSLRFGKHICHPLKIDVYKKTFIMDKHSSAIFKHSIRPFSDSIELFKEIDQHILQFTAKIQNGQCVLYYILDLHHSTVTVMTK